MWQSENCDVCANILQLKSYMRNQAGGLCQWRSPAVLVHFILIFNDLIEYPANIIVDGDGL